MLFMLPRHWSWSHKHRVLLEGWEVLTTLTHCCHCSNAVMHITFTSLITMVVDKCQMWHFWWTIMFQEIIPYLIGLQKCLISEWVNEYLLPTKPLFGFYVSTIVQKALVLYSSVSFYQVIYATVRNMGWVDHWWVQIKFKAAWKMEPVWLHLQR